LWLPFPPAIKGLKLRMYKTNRLIHILVISLLSLGMLFLFAGTASAHTAHAKVLSATPAIGSTIAQAPDRVTVECAENINPDPKLSNLFVYSPTGELISQGSAQVNLNLPTEMSVVIKPTGSGVYIVRWITVSAIDGDPDQGAYFFTVKSQVPSRVAANTITPTPSSNSVSGGTPLWATILVGVLALLVGLGGGLLIRRASPSSFGKMRQTVLSQQQPKGKS
jgi:copper resistance protein C